jgi:hypothetical protein
MMPLDYYLWWHMKSLVYETESQMVAEVTGCIFKATVQMRNDSTMPCRATSSLLKKTRTCPREGGGNFEQLL